MNKYLDFIPDQEEKELLEQMTAFIHEFAAGRIKLEI